MLLSHKSFPHWRKSRHSALKDDCVEVAPVRGDIAVRDSKNPDGPVLTFSPATWRAFVAHLS
ncbi:protein of unknown function (DUF397) [Streptoalloteichus tenebrarius]|uniref:DUF397 domain-containing protein n=1 Tax=Streptoalloteichus tenebrarius (strain ATCC 17920 / DSM 40477 / JCM 4838 / CBS 697.72 / NBRC 16177 / NCIMB 11028 / NRRL B-12390 / A12253. 1 / ISP 5477) TaxID=1933 RepID=A0ABT1HMM0_STRSD|nr:DUF397 domain-containing protein [Streptoalloteichus tenebrarius]MCP2256733.1 protein of unknown function (DUF397) [Streptoalloteichus tenebrarius]BFF00365.1 hypothetical protein GCM10020241_20400 [Streptoalloteichus tenebrarius]